MTTFEDSIHLRPAANVYALVKVSRPFTTADESFGQMRFRVVLTVRSGAPPNGDQQVSMRTATMGHADGSDASLRSAFDREAVVAFVVQEIDAVLRDPRFAGALLHQYQDVLRGNLEALAEKKEHAPPEEKRRP